MLIEEEVAGFRLKVRLGGKHPARSHNSLIICKKNQFFIPAVKSCEPFTYAGKFQMVSVVERVPKVTR